MIINNIPLINCYKNSTGKYYGLCSYPRSGGTHFLGLLNLLYKNGKPQCRFFASHYLSDFQQNQDVLDTTFLLLRHPVYCCVSLWEFEYRVNNIEYDFFPFMDNKINEWINHLDSALTMNWKNIVFYHDIIFRKIDTTCKALSRAGLEHFTPDNIPQNLNDKITDYCCINPHFQCDYTERNITNFKYYSRKNFAKYWNMTNDWFASRNINLMGV